MLYAAYGSNLHPVRLQERVPSAELLGTGVVSGRELRFHKRSFVDGSGKCDIVPGDGLVHVAVYDVPEDEKPLLDGFEGLGKGYRVEIVDVPGFSPCFTYVAMDDHVDASLRPYDWYVRLVLIGCAYHGFPRDYVQAIAIPVLDDAWELDEDPDAERRAAAEEVLRAARMLAVPDVGGVVQRFFDAEERRYVDVFCRDDGTFGFSESKWSDEPLEMMWLEQGDQQSYSDTADTAMREARGRIRWFREMLADA